MYQYINSLRSPGFVFVKKEKKTHGFSLRFPDETSCRLHFKMVRKNEGITCENCKGTKQHWLQSKYHMIKIEYLQNYLNEFCYRLNRRHIGEKFFYRMAIAIVGN
jgi:hypothetical protein